MPNVVAVRRNRRSVDRLAEGGSHTGPRARSPHHPGPKAIFGLDDLLRPAIVLLPERGNAMAFKPNYNLQRADRDRAARARNEEKQKKRDEKAAERRAKREGAVEPPSDGEKS
jgi:hypothetical protein